MVWRRLRAGELDHELIWLLVSLGAALLTGFWLAFDLPIPRCTWRALTGLACPSCGATRCVRWLCGGDFLAALQINPLLFFAIVGMVIYDLYAALVLVFRLPRLRFEAVSSRVGNLIRFGAAAVLLLNWGWLIVRGT